jgi:hypothetical protein
LQADECDQLLADQVRACVAPVACPGSASYRAGHLGEGGLRVEAIREALAHVDAALTLLDKEGAYGSPAACSLSMGRDDLVAALEAALKISELQPSVLR